MTAYMSTYMITLLNISDYMYAHIFNFSYERLYEHLYEHLYERLYNHFCCSSIRASLQTR